MKVFSTLLFSFLTLHSLAQLNELLISSVFKTGIPGIVNRPVQICRGSLSSVLPQQRDTISKPAGEEITIYSPGLTRKKVDTIPAGYICREFKPGGPAGKITGLSIPAIKPAKTVLAIPFDSSKIITTRKRGEPFLVQPAKDTVHPSRVRIHCYQRKIDGNSQPLIVLSGVPVREDVFSKLNPNRIQNITIMKGPQAMALYGKDAVDGVIIITLKLQYKQFIIIDSTDNSPIARATAGITMKNGDNTMWYIADDKGVFASNSPVEFNGLKMVITAAGYEAATRYFNGDISQTDTIRLKRNVKTCEEVILTQIQCYIRRRCSGRYTCNRLLCGVIAIRITNDSVAAEKGQPGLVELKVYPTLLQKGQTVNIHFSQGKKKHGTVRVLGPNGALLKSMNIPSNKGDGPFQLPTDPRWTAGIYFVQLVYENGRVAASGKIIIQ